MNNLMKALSVSALCMSAFGVVHAADAHEKKQISVCKSKSEGTPVTYAYKGVIYNGTCQPADDGKLKFQPPMPPANAPAPVSTPLQMQENQSAPQPISAPPVEVAPPILQSAPPAMPAVAPQATPADMEQPDAEAVEDVDAPNIES
ncbi:hypothetical protein MKI79_08970 [Acinetobacter sp. A3.8]|uniref:Uncharacterized protein n=1 Tax=Acinetobacter sedimenti TaxID=2919922 RepID=A0A9X1WY41_9GAMM|nr:hypothetical protein [Acinetobacter sedimenti]MCJ8147030.1 hypothetical protein [Acinetobacter sedimenti]